MACPRDLDGTPKGKPFFGLLLSAALCNSLLLSAALCCSGVHLNGCLLLLFRRPHRKRVHQQRITLLLGVGLRGDAENSQPSHGIEIREGREDRLNHFLVYPLSAAGNFRWGVLFRWGIRGGCRNGPPPPQSQALYKPQKRVNPKMVYMAWVASTPRRQQGI